MPQAAKIEVQIDKNSEIRDMHSSQGSDEFAKVPAEVDVFTNEADFAPIFYEDNDLNDLNDDEAFFENFHTGYKRESEHR